MDVEAHARRAWGVYSSRWQETLAVAALPLALLVAVPFIVFATYLVGLLATAVAIVAALALDSSGVANATAWTIAIVAAVVVLAIIAIALLVLPVVAASFIVRACVNPTLAQMMAGGKGGLPGFWQVLREDWAALLLTDVLVNAPLFALVFAVFIPVIVLAAFLGPFAFLAFCLAMPLVLLAVAASFVWMYLTEFATILVRLEGLSPLAAVKESIAMSRRRLLDLAPAYAAYFVMNAMAGQLPLVGLAASQVLVYPLWVLYNASVYLDERDAGRSPRGVGARYVVR